MNMAGASLWLPWLVLIPCLAIWGYSLVDFSQTDERQMRTFSKDIWLVLLVFGSVAALSVARGGPSPAAGRSSSDLVTRDEASPVGLQQLDCPGSLGEVAVASTDKNARSRIPLPRPCL